MEYTATVTVMGKNHEKNIKCHASEILRRIPSIKSDFNPVICHAAAQKPQY